MSDWFARSMTAFFRFFADAFFASRYGHRAVVLETVAGVPGKVAGKVVLVEQNGHRLQIRCEDLIVADHPLAEKPGMTISKPEHIREMWKLTLQQSPPPTKEDVIRFEQQVEERSLSIYEEVAQ